MTLHDIPLHNIVDCEYSPELCVLSVMCYGVKFRISVALDHISNSSILADEFQELVELLESGEDEDDAEINLQNWILKPCYSCFRRLIPAEKPTSMTLQAYYQLTTFYLNLTSQNHILAAGLCDKPPFEDEEPALMPFAELDDFPLITKSKASTFLITADDNPNHDITYDTPSEVKGSNGEINREIRTRVQITEAGLDNSLKIPKLHEIVLSDDGTGVVGLTFDKIKSLGYNLQSEQCIKATEHHEKWKKQVVDMVSQMHKHEIVWGDVHPGNIVINDKFDAWIVDFGGGWVEEFVPPKLQGTKEGDKIGVQRVYDEWLKNQA